MAGHDGMVTREELHQALANTEGRIERAVDRIVESLGDRLDETNRHLRALNGRVTTSETKIAVLQDRSERTQRDASTKGGAWGAVGGGIIGGVIYVLARLFGPPGGQP